MAEAGFRPLAYRAAELQLRLMERARRLPPDCPVAADINVHPVSEIGQRIRDAAGLRDLPREPFPIVPDRCVLG